MLPSLKQYKKWTLPSKYGLWSLFVGILGVALAIYALIPQENILEAVAKEEYKPKVEITDSKYTLWLGDKEKFFTIYFHNKSKGPARKFNVELYSRNKKLDFAKSDNASLYLSGDYEIRPNQEVGVPLAPLTELEGYLQKNVQAGDVLGFGKDSKLPIEIEEKLTAKYMAEGFGNYSTRASPIIVKYTYDGIANHSAVVTTAVYVYIDTTNEG